MNIDYKLIGERIKRMRKSNGITQEILAERLNVSIGYVSQVERGITKISHIDVNELTVLFFFRKLTVTVYGE